MVVIIAPHSVITLNPLNLLLIIKGKLTIITKRAILKLSHFGKLQKFKPTLKDK